MRVAVRDLVVTPSRPAATETRIRDDVVLEPVARHERPACSVRSFEDPFGR